ncbi:ASKHA domain-containing protein [Haliovirga abyssi]|uniref:2Fe-2S ferredoxin-type domain-containing protein n=1 Tax=Haliovirga abyssi TaxID=2996794 RepID=A0AAU9DX79_9FUSO|nr:ASKHA domain-containing protein [Haliovirga abyssi]BDU51001.1 hypothetical protein HLVA_15700 [Haliovirga abyssi]
MVKLYEENGKNILKNIMKSNYEINAPCGGNGTCGKCKIKILNGKFNDISKNEKLLLSEKEIENGIRLACMTEFKDKVEIEIIEKEEFYEKSLLEIDNKKLICTVDLGTTTIEMNFYNKENFEKVGEKKFFNPQIIYGADVISRILYAVESKEKLREIQKILIDRLNRELIGNIEKLVLAGNSTMQHIFLGISPKSLITPPYAPAFTEKKALKGLEIGLNVTGIEVMPNIAGYVGGDTYAVIMGYYNKKEDMDNIVIVDIGTNGEIVLIRDGKFYVTSTAAGPAFEGASLSCGMRATLGALSDIRIDEKVEIQTIGDKPLKGICGSGVIALLRELIYTETIGKDGNIKSKNRYYPFLNRRLKEQKFYLTEDIYISQNDIREIQMAKSSIRSAIDMMENNYDKIKKIIITGNFGKNLDKKGLIKIGLMPNIELDKIKIVDNLVISGLYRYITGEIDEKFYDEFHQKIEYIDLANSDNFKRKFIKNIDF